MTAGSIERTLDSSRLLPGPGSALIRSAGLADAVLIRDFVCSLSPRSLYFRFFASVSPPSTGLLRTLTGAAGSADILLVTDSHGTVIGHGMAADVQVNSRLETNIGLAIGDAWQRRGLGTTLLTMLVSRALRRGVHALVLDVLPDNEPMRGIIRRRWPEAPVERTRDALVFKPVIGAADARRPVDLPVVISLRRDRIDCQAVTHAGGNRVPDRSAA